MFVFGSGALIGQRNDIANGTPINFGLVQEVTIGASRTLKELFGQNNIAVAIGGGTLKLTGKAKMARISGTALSSLFFGATMTTGQTATQFAEAKSVATTTCVSTIANATQDLGLVYAATGQPLQQVASAPAVGQYSYAIAAGVITWTVATADPNKGALLASYNYTIAATGESFTVASQLIGPTPTFSANLFTSYGGNALTVQLFNCVSEKLSFQTKLEDFALPELDFKIFANAAGNAVGFNFGDAA